MGASTFASLSRPCEAGTVGRRNVVVLGDVTYTRLGLLRPVSIVPAVAQAAVSPVPVAGANLWLLDRFAVQAHG